jgi:hypothetical protein
MLTVGFLIAARSGRTLGCDTSQTVALDIVRRPKSTPIHELERYLHCKDCSQVRGPFGGMIAARAKSHNREIGVRSVD